jgi:hypothetical protein
LVNYGDPDGPDPADDSDSSIHEFRDDAIHNQDIPHSSSSTGASCFFSVQIRCNAFLSMFLVARHVLVVRHKCWDSYRKTPNQPPNFRLIFRLIST